MAAKKLNTGIYWEGIYLEVDGYYDGPAFGDALTAPTPPHFEYEKIKYGGVDIQEVLLAAKVDMMEIERLVIEKLKNK